MLIAVRNDVMKADGSQAGAVGALGADGAVLLQSRRRRPAPSGVGTAPAPAVHLRSSEAAEAWNATKDTTNVAVLDAFVARYGDTFYAELARARIAELQK